MNAPLTATQANAIHELQCRARRLGVTLDLHFTVDFRVVMLLDGREFLSIEDAAAHVALLETAR